MVLVTFMPDDSASIRFAGHAQVVRDGHNLVLDALLASRQRDAILAHNRYLNGDVLLPVLPDRPRRADDGAELPPGQGDPPLRSDGGVARHRDQVKTRQELAGNGVPARTVTLLLTDGADQSSTRAKARDVLAIVRDMAATENHIIAAMGIDDGTTPFRDVFRSMGIEDRWILTPGNDPAEIRKAFLVFSQSAVKASQGGASFSRTAAGGFGK